MSRPDGVLAAWQFTPQISLALLLVACWYVRGWRRRMRTPRRSRPFNWRPACFLSGLLCLYAALQSPLDFLAEHLFLVHQVQHLLLMMVGPILLLAPAPERELTAGLPGRARRLLLAPIVGNRAVRAVVRSLTHPCTATALAGGTLYFWMIPAVYDTALSHERVHDLMHLCLLLSGLVFWSRVLDRRPPPVGTSYLGRAAMLKVNLMMVAALGGYLTSKQYPLYRDSGFDLLSITSLVDERIGGAILWLGGSAILLAAMAVTIRRWISVEAEQVAVARFSEDAPADFPDARLLPAARTGPGAT